MDEERRIGRWTTIHNPNGTTTFTYRMDEHFLTPNRVFDEMLREQMRQLNGQGFWFYDEIMNEREKKMEEELEQLAKVEIERGDKTTCLTILEQYKYDFTRNYLIGDKKFYIKSVNVIEYRHYENTLYLKGDQDAYRENLSVEIPNEDFDWFWDTVKNDFIIASDEVEEVVERNVDFSLTREPNDEEIEKMISLVKIDTFTKIIKNRLYQEMPSADRKHLEDYGRKWAKEYLKRWARAKYRFYKIFGDKLTVTKEVEVKPDKNTIKNKWDEIINEFPLLRYSLSNIPTDWIREDTIYANGSYFFDSKEVKSGMNFTKFITLFENKKLDIAVSKLYQDLGKTKLHLSIDPIDYLTVSINKSGWQSCHHFFDGCYRNAGLSYMFDYCTFVSFTSNKDTTYTNCNMPFTWNSKGWRQMVYSARKSSATVFSRQYPYNSDELSKYVRETYEELVCKYFNCESKWKVFQSEMSADVDVFRTDDVENLYNDVKEGYGHKVVKNKADIRYDEEIGIPIGSEYGAFNRDYTVYGGEDYLWYGKEEYDEYDEEYDEDEG